MIENGLEGLLGCGPLAVEIKLAGRGELHEALLQIGEGGILLEFGKSAD
jgi:hypothetical protein